MEIYSKHCQSQTGRARELTFCENVHPTLCVMCHMLCGECGCGGGDDGGGGGSGGGRGDRQ